MKRRYRRHDRAHQDQAREHVCRAIRYFHRDWHVNAARSPALPVGRNRVWLLIWATVQTSGDDNVTRFV